MDLKALTNQELDIHARDVIAEQERRLILAESEARMEEVAETYQRAIGREDGAEWVQPTHALDAYGYGSVVTRDGRRFRSTHHANVWDPLDAHGSRYWAEEWIDEETGEPTEENPDGPEAWDPAKQYWPPAAVEHEGVVYDLTHTNADPGWEPGADGMHGIWKPRT